MSKAPAGCSGAAPLLRGTVVHGDRRGRELGFPTANLAFDYTPALPALGIYLGRVTVAERGVGPGHPALVSVGVRPTFHDDGRVLVEVYLLDWDGDLYDADARRWSSTPGCARSGDSTRSTRSWTRCGPTRPRRAGCSPSALSPGPIVAADGGLW